MRIRGTTFDPAQINISRIWPSLFLEAFSWGNHHGHGRLKHRSSRPGTLAFDHFLHDLLRSLDDLLDHRHPIKQELGLNDTQFGLLVGTPILSGSLIRLMLGIWTDQYGGRRVYTVVMLAAAVATYLLTWAHTYPEFLVAALFVGIAGGSFAVGIAYVSRFYPTGKQGIALGIFGAGNVGAAVTKFVAPFVLVAYGWQTVAQVWALVIGLMGIIFWLFSDEDPVVRARREKNEKPSQRLA